MITKVTDTHFTVVSFEDRKEIEYEKSDYFDLEKDWTDSCVAGIHNHYKNQIWLVEKARVDQYVIEKETEKNNRIVALNKVIEDSNNELTALESVNLNEYIQNLIAQVA